ncbi:FUSC family protein [Flavobacterium sp. Sd200]|uniref:FUSC family protein n=1 Tax=Flavobacterium sp. Sd200 TaxID=2692211 RepID=UPI00136B4D9D|nr:FUSC family protein [Flavobacterium sp. Sd200]MXN89751.1 FUSC family protein [Flavobacterium sp. Sd200]
MNAQKLVTEIRELYVLKPSPRGWHIPFLASLCVGLPLLAGYFLGNVHNGSLASMAGLVILYLPEASFTKRMVTLMACSFGLMASFFIGLLFSFNPILSAVVLGGFTHLVHWSTKYFKLKPPSNFFFIMLASIGFCMPHNMALIPYKTGLVGMGCMSACLLALVYGILVKSKTTDDVSATTQNLRGFTSHIESAIFGLSIGSSLLIAKILELDNPYWVPVSCLAVMQGVSAKHVWQRSLQRVVGTLLGLSLAWVLLLLKLPEWAICAVIMVMQFVVEMFITRNYAYAVVFITSLTLMLAEFGSAIANHPNELVTARFTDIFIGSAVGAVGGYFLYHQKLKNKMARQLRKTRVILKR